MERSRVWGRDEFAVAALVFHQAAGLEAVGEGAAAAVDAGTAAFPATPLQQGDAVALGLRPLVAPRPGKGRAVLHW